MCKMFTGNNGGGGGGGRYERDRSFNLISKGWGGGVIAYNSFTLLLSIAKDLKLP